MEIPPTPEQLIRPTSSASSTPVPVRPAELLAQLQPGQTLLAKVERLISNTELELRVGNQLVRANSPVQLAAGQPIKLLVEATSQGNILRITQQASQVETLARAWRTVLPKQQPIADVVKQLVQTLANSKTDLKTANPGLPTNSAATLNNPSAASLRTAIQNLVTNLPTVKTVSQADGLRQAIRDSGVTLEAQLRNSIITGTTPRSDNNIKANFLRIAQSALQLQANTAQTTAATTPGANPAAGTATNKAGPINAYTNLLTAATQSQGIEKSSPTTRPLLPPLPILPADSTSKPLVNRLAAALPPILQRLLPLPLLATSQQTQTVATAVQQAPASQQVFSTLIVELLNQMESGLARIQQHQLSSLPGDEVIRHFLNLELPVFNGKDFDNIGVRFEWDRESADDPENQHQWRVVLNFDFDELGKMQAIIRAGQNEIHTDFKCENEKAQQLFQSNKELLEKGLQQQGLTPGQFTFSTGDIELEEMNNHEANLVKTKV